MQTIQEISAPEYYSPANDLCVITSYYNPEKYVTKLRNYKKFAEIIRKSGIAIYTIELAFGNNEYELEKRPDIVQMRGGDILWQKERMLNLLLNCVPSKYTKIAWIDCDVLFANKDWASEASKQLDQVKVVQLFDTAIRLPKNTENYSGEGEIAKGFISGFITNPGVVEWQRYPEHGVTGFAWAAQRVVLENIKLYDACLTGSADHLMAHSFIGTWKAKCIQNTVGVDTAYSKHYSQWSSKAFSVINSSVSYISGVLLHLWHGETINRGYYERNQELLKMKYNPNNDIFISSNGLWKWNTSNNQLKKWAIKNFSLRKEDGIME